MLFVLILCYSRCLSLIANLQCHMPGKMAGNCLLTCRSKANGDVEAFRDTGSFTFIIGQSTRGCSCGVLMRDQFIPLQCGLCLSSSFSVYDTPTSLTGGSRHGNKWHSLARLMSLFCHFEAVAYDRAQLVCMN